MMSKKQKALEMQLAQCAQTNDALRARLDEAEKHIGECEKVLAKRTAEFESRLSSKDVELLSANRKLDEYKLRQDAIVNALTEAHSTRERIIREAKAEAAEIVKQAELDKANILNEANSVLENAKSRAHASVSAANEEAGEIRRQAAADAEKMSDDALDEASGIIDAAQKEADSLISNANSIVAERTEQLSALNAELKSKARMALEQTELYINMLNLIADSEATYSCPSDCDLNCENCSDKCDSYVPDTSDAPIDSEQSSETTEVPGETVESTDPAEDHSSETVDEPLPNEPSIELPDEYNNVASLMRNIYVLQGREIPDEQTESDESSGVPVNPDNDDLDKEEPLPVDSDLESILKDLI